MIVEVSAAVEGNVLGALHGLGNDDDEEIFIYVLSTLQDRDLVEESLVPLGLSTFGFLDSQSHDPALFDSEDVQSIMKYLCPCPFSWSVINKWFLPSDFLVKHGTLRLLLEALKLLDTFIVALNHGSYSRDQMMQGWTALKQEIQHEIQTLIPAPQVLLILVSSLTRHPKTRESCLKRIVDLEAFPECSSNNIKNLKLNKKNSA